jgi:hypothetical protein
MVVENFYKKSANAVKRGSDKPPYGFVIPAGQKDQAQVDRVANLLRRQAVEVHRATAEIKVKEGTYPAGSYVVKLNQPYGPLAKTLIEKQNYPDASLTTYDDSAWSMGMASNVDIKTIEDKTILDVPATLLTADVVTAGSVSGTGAVTVVKHNGALNLITLRYRLKDVPMKAAKAAFKIGDVEYPAGSLIIESAADRTKKEVESLGLIATAVASAPSVETINVDLPRIAVYTTWNNTEKVGWVRLAFDRWEIPYDLIHKDHVQAGANLHAKYDVILIPHQGQDGKSLVYEQPKLSKPLAYKKSDKFKSLGMYAETDDVRGGMGLAGAAELQKFVDSGGVLITMGVASFFPADFGLARGVGAQAPNPGFYAPGPYVNSEILIPNHPTMFGYSQKTLPVRYAGGPLLQAGPPAGFEQLVGSSSERPQVVARFTGGEAGVLSGLMRQPDQIRNRPMVVDAPSGKGRVILFANNPVYRWQTFGEHTMLFNSLLFWNDMDANATAKPAPTAGQQ